MRRVTTRLRWGLAIGAATAVVMAGCSGSPADEAGTTTPVATSAAPPPTTTTPPPPAVQPVPTVTEGPCPYLDQSYVEETIGQRIARVEVATFEPVVGPQPNCTFYKPNDEAAVIVTTATTPSPVEAATAALAAIGDAGNPVDPEAAGGAGDGGAVIVSASQTICAVSKGQHVVTITINQESSLEATEIATTVAATIPV